MVDLSDRQQQLLKDIVEIYVKTGEPISSELIEKSYNLGVSPATIRNEMAKLSDLGYLKQPHTSAGRVPTALGFRVYINGLMKEKELPVVDEVAIRQQVFDNRTQINRMFQTATRALAKKCGTIAMVVNDGEVFYTGAANILDLPEFFDIDVTRFVLSMFDECSLLQQILDKAQGSEPMHIIFGEETGFEYLRPTSFAFVNFQSGVDDRGVIGVIGPDRLNFPVVLPYLRYVGRVLDEAARSV
jgi:heat-inducible transcriptional repressor